MGWPVSKETRKWFEDDVSQVKDFKAASLEAQMGAFSAKEKNHAVTAANVPNM